MSETPALFDVQPPAAPALPPRDCLVGTIAAAEVNPLDGSSTIAPLPVWVTADNNVQMGDHLLTDAAQVLTLVSHLLTALRIMQIERDL